ncbi:MAG: helix-turn-helix domain-containing protein [Nocardioides sp.]|uniref:helix-turn-helix transcriptional regulator n=1 Tax=Nocardioides sp. TaxID=35761 RepID=UPI0039E6FEFF
MAARGRRTPGRRLEVLQVLRESARPMAIAEIADLLGVHVNTVRFHLKTLVDSGRVEQASTVGNGPGRPAQVFRVVRGMDPTGPRRYEVLAEALATGLSADPDSRDRAVAAGRVWGRQQASSADRSADDGDGRDPSGAGPDATSSTVMLIELLDELGFAPERVGDDQTSGIGLRHCPFLDLALDRPDVVCSLHLGLMQGAMSSWGSSVSVDRLDPFVRPDLCLAHLAPAGTV